MDEDEKKYSVELADLPRCPLPVFPHQADLKPINLLPWRETTGTGRQEHQLGTDCKCYNCCLDISGLQIKGKPPSPSYSATKLRAARRSILCKMGLDNLWHDKRKLFAAIQNRDCMKVAELLEEGMNPHVLDSKSRTPLHVAASQGLSPIVTMLLSKGADPNAQDILGNTPLHLAVSRGDTVSIRSLIHHGSDIHIMDRAGRAPLDLLKKRLTSVKRNRCIHMNSLNSEFSLMYEFLKSHAYTTRSESVGNLVEDICDTMHKVSTKEQADEFTDGLINKMSTMSIEHKEKSQQTTQQWAVFR